jgi:hypothetical protein
LTLKSRYAPGSDERGERGVGDGGEEGARGGASEGDAPDAPPPDPPAAPLVLGIVCHLHRRDAVDERVRAGLAPEVASSSEKSSTQDVSARSPTSPEPDAIASDGVQEPEARGEGTRASGEVSGETDANFSSQTFRLAK